MFQAAQMINQQLDCYSEYKFLTHMPTGPLNRVADNSLAKKLLDWSPQTTFAEGLRKTIDWYVKSKNEAEVAELLCDKLLER